MIIHFTLDIDSSSSKYGFFDGYLSHPGPNIYCRILISAGVELIFLPGRWYSAVVWICIFLSISTPAESSDTELSI